MGALPAADVGKSVSRVGGKAQRAAYRAVAGDLKLAYAQFEELEGFSRFGARLDDNTRKIIDHGRRIRACLKQPEFDPVSVAAQITILLALTEALFDPVPLDQMTDAEHAVRAAAEQIPADVRGRFETAATLSDEDRKTIIAIARQALTPFQPKPKPANKPTTDTKPETKQGGESKPEAEPKPHSEAKPRPDTAPKLDAGSHPDGPEKPRPEAEPKPKAQAKVK